MEINAVNSYNQPIHITYDGTTVGSSLENTEVETNNVRKVIENNQILIIKEGVKYNVLGSIVK